MGTAACVAMLPISCDLLNRPAVGQLLAEHVRQSETINGVVTDPSGAVVPGAAVTLMGPNGAISATKSGPTGRYTLRAEPGTYTLVVEAKGFANFASEPMQLEQRSGREERNLDVRLKIALLVDVQVPEDSALDGDRSGMTLVLNARQVEQMPMDSKALLEELQGLAGSPNARVVVDGFSDSKLPPRDSIREVRINQNPYSAENDTDTVSGVIQVLSKPGTNQLHGYAYLYGDDSALNAENPFARDQPPYYADGAGGDVTGSMNDRTSFYTLLEERQDKMNSAVDAEMVDETINLVPAVYTVQSPRSILNAAGRVDTRVGRSSTLILRYTFDRELQTNGGVGQLALASQAIDTGSLVHTFQAANTVVFSPALVNEARLQYIRTRTAQTPVSKEPAVIVQGAFLDGGNDRGSQDEHRDSFELSDNLAISKKMHYLDVGARVRLGRDSIASQANFNGEFIFSSLSSYQITLRGMATGQTIAQIIAAGGGANQYSVTAGDPNASALIADIAVYAQDSWRIRDNLKLSYGLRFETQNYITDHTDFAPRVAFSWAFGSGSKNGISAGPRYVVHGGAGLFYQRFAVDSALNVQRQNGVTQQEYVIASPQFCPPVPGIAMGCAGMHSLGTQPAGTVYRMSGDFQAPRFIEESIGVTRQLGTLGSVGVTYLNSRGVHTQFTANVNAPLAGSYNSINPAGGVRPDGTNRNIYQYMSEGVSRSNVLTTQLIAGRGRVHWSANYILRFSKSDAESDGTFPLNVYTLGTDYGRSLADVRHSGNVGGDVNLPYGMHLWTLLRATSGAPFNIIVGRDLNGDTQYNDRPAFATDLMRPSVVVTRWGSFDANPTTGQTIIPRNYGQGPGRLSLDMGFGKSIGIGPAKDVGRTGSATTVERKYTIDLWIQLLNALNHPNYAPPVTVVNSPLFGQSVGLVGGSSLSPGRVVDMQLSMRF